MSIDAVLSSVVRAAIITVGPGRGFLVEALRERMVITAAHCLPHLPAALSDERTYHTLLGTLGAEPTVSAECLFVDPIGDLAVLGCPDSQMEDDASDAYLNFVDSGSALRLDVVTTPCEAWLLTLDDRWTRCSVRLSNPYGPARSLTLVDAKDGNAAGTSGSPILSADGRAIGVISVGAETVSLDGQTRVVQAEQPGQPLLASALPLWLLSELRSDVVKAVAACRAYRGALRHVIGGSKNGARERVIVARAPRRKHC